jgi:hypothetical protein
LKQNKPVNDIIRTRFNTALIAKLNLEVSWQEREEPPVVTKRTKDYNILPKK